METDPFLTESRRPDTVEPTTAPTTRGSSLLPARWRNKDRPVAQKPRKGPSSVAVPVTAGTTVGASVLIFFPFLYFLIIALLYAFVYHHSRIGCYVPIGFMAVVAVAIGMLHMVERVKKVSGPWYLFMGILLITAIVFGVTCGIYNYNHYFARYWSFDEFESYHQVLASEPAASKMDAGKITFADSASLDRGNAVGFKSGNRFCAAPITDSDDPIVNYFAVGQNCCNSRGNFNCDDSDDARARSGVVVLPTDVEYDLYMKAVHLCQAQNGYQSPLAGGVTATSTGSSGSTNAERINPIILRWVIDASSLQGDYYSKGVGFLVASVFIYLFVCVCLGAILAYTGRRYEKYAVVSSSEFENGGNSPVATVSGAFSAVPARSDSFLANEP